MYQAYTGYFAIGFLLLLLGACGSNSNNRSLPSETMLIPTQSYRITISNLSYAQPMSPVAVILHNNGYRGWTLGGAASDALEQLAEGGDNSAFIDAADAILKVSGEGIIMPGATEDFDLVVNEMPELQLTIVSMLVNTNDAFTGITGADLTQLGVGESQVIELPVYDAGTEANMELMGSIPGPADGGVGYDAMRDDVDYVAGHPGVVGSANGYSESVLDESHRFDAPLALLTVTRVE